MRGDHQRGVINREQRGVIIRGGGLSERSVNPSKKKGTFRRLLEEAYMKNFDKTWSANRLKGIRRVL